MKVWARECLASIRALAEDNDLLTITLLDQHLFEDGVAGGIGFYSRAFDPAKGGSLEAAQTLVIAEPSVEEDEEAMDAWRTAVQDATRSMCWPYQYSFCDAERVMFVILHCRPAVERVFDALVAHTKEVMHAHGIDDVCVRTGVEYCADGGSLPFAGGSSAAASTSASAVASPVSPRAAALDFRSARGSPIAAPEVWRLGRAPARAPRSAYFKKFSP
jgi:hypothetical protein